MPGFTFRGGGVFLFIDMDKNQQTEAAYGLRILSGLEATRHIPRAIVEMKLRQIRKIVARVPEHSIKTREAR